RFDLGDEVGPHFVHPTTGGKVQDRIALHARQLLSHRKKLVLVSDGHQTLGDVGVDTESPKVTSSDAAEDGSAPRLGARHRARLSDRLVQRRGIHHVERAGHFVHPEAQLGRVSVGIIVGFHRHEHVSTGPRKFDENRAPKVVHPCRLDSRIADAFGSLEVETSEVGAFLKLDDEVEDLVLYRSVQTGVALAEQTRHHHTCTHQTCFPNAAAILFTSSSSSSPSSNNQACHPLRRSHWSLLSQTSMTAANFRSGQQYSTGHKSPLGSPTSPPGSGSGMSSSANRFPIRARRS